MNPDTQAYALCAEALFASTLDEDGLDACAQRAAELSAWMVGRGWTNGQAIAAMFTVQASVIRLLLEP